MRRALQRLQPYHGHIFSLGHLCFHWNLERNLSEDYYNLSLCILMLVEQQGPAGFHHNPGAKAPLVKITNREVAMVIDEVEYPTLHADLQDLGHDEYEAQWCLIPEPDAEKVRIEADKRGLDWKATLEGIQQEVDSLKEFDVFEQVDFEEIPGGTEELGTTLVLREKGGAVKARICAQDFAFKKVRDDLFSHTPSVTGLRVLLSLAAQRQQKVRIGDFTTAFLHAPIDFPVFVKAPKVLQSSGDGPIYWRLKKALYCMRKAPQLFNKHLDQVLKGLGMTNLKSEPTYYVKGDLQLLVHVDDPIAAGPDHGVSWLFHELEKVMKFKPGESLTVLREVRYLGKLYRKTAKRFAVKRSKGYYEEIIKEIGLEGCKPRSSPNTTDMKPTTAEAKQRWEMGLNDADHALFRRSVGTLRFVIPERPDLKLR